MTSHRRLRLLARAATVVLVVLAFCPLPPAGSAPEEDASLIGPEEARAFLGQTEARFLIRARPLAEEPGFEVEGLGRLPDGVLLHVALSYAGKVVGWQRDLLVDGRFHARFGPYVDRRLLRGTYAVEVVYYPTRQPRKVGKDRDDPREILRLHTEAVYGTDDEETEDRDRERGWLLDLIDREVGRLADEHTGFLKAAREGTGFVIGKERAFDAGAWRDWVDGWRRRMREATGGALEGYQAEVVAPTFPEALSKVKVIGQRWHELSRVWSQELYDLKGRTLDPADRFHPLEIHLSAPAIEQKLLELEDTVEMLVGGRPPPPPQPQDR